MSIRKINVAAEFSDYLVNRNNLQGDGTKTGEDFRTQFLLDLENDSWWDKSENIIIFNFKDVRTIGPSWANEVFAYYANKRNKSTVLSHLKFENISPVKLEIIELEIESGYATKIK